MSTIERISRVKEYRQQEVSSKRIKKDVSGNVDDEIRSRQSNSREKISSESLKTVQSNEIENFKNEVRGKGRRKGRRSKDVSDESAPVNENSGSSQSLSSSGSSQNSGQPSSGNATTLINQQQGSTQAGSMQSSIASSQNVQSLAQKYVSQYEKNAGVTLSTEERKAMETDVSTFYSRADRVGRLEKIVM
jgi:hypothetical protein